MLQVVQVHAKTLYVVPVQPIVDYTEDIFDFEKDCQLTRQPARKRRWAFKVNGHHSDNSQEHNSHKANEQHNEHQHQHHKPDKNAQDAQQKN